MSSIAELFDQAVRCHQSGDLALADSLYRQILRADPRAADAWHLLGLLARQVARYDLAIEYIGAAIRLVPDFAPAHSNLGIVLRAQGKLAEAEASCREALRLQPDYAEAHSNLGNILRDQGRLKEAEVIYGDAIRHKPDYVEAHINLGVILQDQGRLEEAEAIFRAALRLQPEYAEAHSKLATVLCQQGKPADAEACFRELLRIQPEDAEGHYNLGNVLRGQDKLEQAEVCLRQALYLQPDHAEAHNNLGNVLRGQGKLEEAETCWRAALRLRPDFAEAHSNLGASLRAQRRLDEAEACLREALRLRPAYVEAQYNLGNVIHDQGKLEEAEACWRAVLRLKPDFAEAHCNLGVFLQDHGRLEEAEGSFCQALHFRPGFPEAHNNLANVHRDQGKLEEAEASCREALRLKPDYAEAHFTLSYLLLLQGDFGRGWPEYEWRRQCKEKLGRTPPPPSWDGSPLDGRTILLHVEQGFGDTFQFARYAPLVQARGGRVLLQCPASLTGILAGCPGIDQLVPAEEPLPSFQVASPLLSLPMLCGTTLESIPAEVPYLVVAPARVDRWRTRLAAIAGFKVGICWQGNRKVKNDRERSVPLSYFAPLAAVPGVCLVALQRGPGLEQIRQQGEHLTIVDLPGRSEEPAEAWLDTAALIQALDLVISTDTGVVHLAGALGAPAWVALPFMPDWRWLANREDSPWYPTMRLFRQKKPGDWAEVFQRLARELRSFEF